jgi:hypothetical protein
MRGLDLWLKQATRGLSAESSARVLVEIHQHYESARDAAIESGVPADQAEPAALAALGDAGAANREYRKVLLTSAEARLLREGHWEARAVCSRPQVRALSRWVPAAMVAAAAILFAFGDAGTARILLVAGIGFGFLLLAPRLPVFTPSRSRIVRYAKWITLAAMPVAAFGQDWVKYSWLAIACLWPVAWVEWTRHSIRRKLPAAQWPKHLYL